ncbi:MAG: amino acid racemase [Trueperaceae bacterium]|nr:amino acid racemase [Trueperaceae bacterium]
MTGRVVGVLGGMGPAATWDFCSRLTAATPATKDQDHLRVLVDADPSVPDRNAALEGRGPSPGPRLAAMARGLERAGAEVLCMPCNAAHAFADDVRDATVVPFVDMIEATVEATMKRVPDARRVGLLATTATLDAGLYERVFRERGVEVVIPAPAQRDEMMAAIYAVKTGELGPATRAAMRRAAQAAVAAGAEALVAACTEVPLALTQEDLEVPLVVSSEALAVVVVRIATRTEP